MQHASLTLERWAAFPRDEQLLMIANEMNRASKLLAPQDESRLTTADGPDGGGSAGSRPDPGTAALA